MDDEEELLFPITEDIAEISFDEDSDYEDEDDYSGVSFNSKYVNDEKYMTYCVERVFEERVLFPLEQGHSVGNFTNELDRVLREYSKKIEDARQKGKRRPRLEKRVQRITRALHKFIRAMCLKYVEVRPRPFAKDRFPYSTGRYQRSSIMYFTKDASSRNRALAEARSNAFDENKPFYGMQFILDETNMSRIFRPDGNVQSRIERIRGGITLENVAFEQHKDGSRRYYGWLNVECFGWGDRKPYRPFQSAVDYAQREVSGLVKVTRYD